VRHLTERFIVRIGRDDLDEARATGAGLGMNLSRFVRTSLKERAALERALRRNDDQKGGDHE
jgi:RNase P/RNase MRP subunit p30